MSNLLQTVTDTAINPALALLPVRMDTPAARVLLLAIGLQESRLTHRRQINGPARGLWQFERGGGVRGVLNHTATERHADALCKVRNVLPTPEAVYAALEVDDVLAAGFARLLMWSDPAPVPTTPDSAWAFYAYRTWRPGKPHRQTWDKFFQVAQDFVLGGDQ